MPWCPKCRTEYEDWVKKCSDCGEDLVDELEPEEEAEPIEYGEEALLTTVPDDVQANFMESLLKAYDIPVYKRYKSTGAYMEVYMGMAKFGVDIFVPLKLLPQAREVLQSQPSEIGNMIEESEEAELYELNRQYQKKRILRSWIALFLFLIPLIIGLYLYLRNLYS